MGDWRYSMVEAKSGRRKLLVVVGLVLLTCLVTIILLRFRSGIRVTIQNTGSQPMRMVSLSVTGKSYSLGDLAPGAAATATVKPTGESGLGIGFTDRDGKQQGLNADCYIEPGNRGTIRVSIKDGAIEKTDSQITYP
jgi:hypothetical protein